jgi:undecaprenyl-diphosphatase
MTMRALLHQLSVLEAPLCRAANQRGDDLETQRFFVVVSRLGDGVFWYIIMLLLPALFGKAGALVAAQMLAVGVVSLLVYKVLKSVTVRRRPCESFPDIRRHAPMLDLYSFPSGHTMHAVGFTAVLIAHYPSLGLLVTPFALLVASSRLVLGLHYPSDVVFGALIGGGVAWASFLFLN